MCTRYWEQPGRMTFTHLMRSKHPEIGYIMAEQCDDVDSILVAPSPRLSS